jgi:cobalt-zinc-cadmium efflux system outer membrane protein
MNRLLLRKAILCLCASACARTLVAAPVTGITPGIDTVQIDIAQAEQRLVGNSLMLLAARYNADIAKSEVTQARAWYNPNIIYAQTLYDPSTGTWADNSPASGQVDVQVNQMFSIAGRHINAVRLAEINVQKNQLAFDDLARALKFEMYNDLAGLYEAQQTDIVYATEIDALDNVINASLQELKLGATAGNDVIRLKAERQSDIDEKLANMNFIEAAESDLQLLLGFPGNSWLKIAKLPMPAGNIPALDSLLQLAMKRPDVQLASTDVKWNQRNYSLQRSQGVPDLLIGTEYDRRSSYVNNLWMIQAGIDIPIFNRNQGNIHAAKYAVLQAEYNDTLQQHTALSEVVASYGQFIRIRQVRDSVFVQPGVISYKSQTDPGSYSSDIDLLFVNAVENYSKRRISLIEFLDQLRTYEDARLGLITLDSDYYKAAQELNYSTGQTIIR